jgi:hypothetical protein
MVGAKTTVRHFRPVNIPYLLSTYLMRKKMIWSGRKTYEQRQLEKKEKENWHKWFAWYPVNIGECGGRYQKAWLCPVFRKKVKLETFDGYYYRWKYNTNINEVMVDVLNIKEPVPTTRPSRPPPPPKVKPTPIPTGGVRRTMG